MEHKPYHLCFETLSNELRLRILEALQQGSMSVTALVEKVGAERSAVSHSLQMLKLCSYVQVKKVGKEMIYSLKDNTSLAISRAGTSVFQIIDTHVDHHCKTCKKIEVMH